MVVACTAAMKSLSGHMAPTMTANANGLGYVADSEMDGWDVHTDPDAPVLLAIISPRFTGGRLGHSSTAITYMKITAPIVQDTENMPISIQLETFREATLLQ